jgi:chorismate mutase/prephenate dehydratase
LQKDIVIAYLGPRGSYTQTAAFQRFGDSVTYSDQNTIKDVFAAVESKAVTYGVVPFENSTFGSVTQTLDCFITSRDIKIRAESYLPIHHCLLSNGSLNAITKVYSHAQVLFAVQGRRKDHPPFDISC